MTGCRCRYMTDSNNSPSVFSAAEMRRKGKWEVLLPWALVNPLCFVPTHPKVIEPKMPQVVARENCMTKFAELRRRVFNLACGSGSVSPYEVMGKKLEVEVGARGEKPRKLWDKHGNSAL